MEFVSREPLPNEVVMDYSMLGGAGDNRGRKLFLTGVAGLIAALVYFGFNAKVDNTAHLVLGLAMFTLALLPGLFWARTGGSRFPVFETIMVLCANTYALPTLNAREQLSGYSDDVITRAAIAVLLYQISALGVYFKTRGIPGRSPFWRDSIITHQIEQLVVYGIVLSTTYVGITTFTNWVPREMESVLRAIFYGIGTLCTFVSAQRWGKGEMSESDKIVFMCTLIPQLIFMSVSLVLIGAISLVGIGFLGYLAGSKRIPWLAIILTFSVIAVLHTGKTQMRLNYWENKRPAPTITELPGFFAEWIENGLNPAHGEKNASQRLLERTSLMHILCVVVEWSPEKQDYLYGQSYTHVLPQLIPRLFWPDKPRSHVATYELGIYYGLQNEEDTNATTIAFGLVTEAYANFGMFGPILLGCFWGFWLKKLQIWSTFSPMFSFAGLLMVLLTAWSFSSELTMAAWVSSLEQAVIVVLGIPMIIRAIFGL